MRGDNAGRSDAQQRRLWDSGDDAERSDAQQRRALNLPDGGSTW